MRQLQHLLGAGHGRPSACQTRLKDRLQVGQVGLGFSFGLQDFAVAQERLRMVRAWDVPLRPSQGFAENGYPKARGLGTLQGCSRACQLPISRANSHTRNQDISAKATDWTVLQGVNVISRLEALSFLVPRNARSEQCERT